MSVRVFLVDDEPAVRKGLGVLLSREPDLEICGETGLAPDALKQILALDPDLVIIDLGLLKGSGVDLIRDLRSFSRKPRILVFSMHSEAAYIRAAFRAGADGYVIKDEGTENLIDAIRAVRKGQSFLTEAVASRLGIASADLRAERPRAPRHE